MIHKSLGTGKIRISFYTTIVLDKIVWFNTLRPRQNGRHFADDIFKRIFMNENVGISINISLKLVPKNLINNIPALVQMMAWRRPGDKPLSEPMIVNLLTYICVTRPQWVNETIWIWLNSLIQMQSFYPYQHKWTVDFVGLLYLFYTEWKISQEPKKWYKTSVLHNESFNFGIFVQIAITLSELSDLKKHSDKPCYDAPMNYYACVHIQMLKILYNIPTYLCRHD